MERERGGGRREDGRVGGERMEGREERGWKGGRRGIKTDKSSELFAIYYQLPLTTGSVSSVCSDRETGGA